MARSVGSNPALGAVFSISITSVTVLPVLITVSNLSGTYGLAVRLLCVWVFNSRLSLTERVPNPGRRTEAGTQHAGFKLQLPHRKLGVMVNTHSP